MGRGSGPVGTDLCMIKREEVMLDGSSTGGRERT